MTPRARRALFSVVLFFAVCAVVGSVLQRRVGAQSAHRREPASRQPQVVHRCLLARRAELRRAHQRRQGRHRHLRRRHSRHAARARSALQLLRSQGLRPPARRSARPLLRRRHGHPAAGQQGLRRSLPTRARPPSAPAFTPATSSPPSTANPPTAGPPTRSPRPSRAPKARTSRSPWFAWARPHRWSSTSSATRFPTPPSISNTRFVPASATSISPSSRRPPATR